MLTIPAPELARTLDRTGRWLIRVEVRPRNEEAWVDLSAYAVGFSTPIGTPDAPAYDFTVTFARTAEDSLAPGVSASDFNRDTEDFFRPLLPPRAYIRGFAANLVKAAANNTAVWRPWFEGEIEVPEWPGSEVICNCKTWDAVLERAQIKGKEARGSDDEEEQPEMEDELQALVYAWPPSLDAALQVLHTPVSPEHAVGLYTPEGSLGAQLRTVAQQIGWDTRYLPDPATGARELTLYEPPRDKTVPDLVLAGYMVERTPGLKEDPTHLRNDFWLIGQDADGREFTVTRTNTASINGGPGYGQGYGEVHMGLVDPQVRTVAQGEALLAYADNDLSKPLAELRIRIPLCPWINTHDLIEIGPLTGKYDFTTVWGVVGGTHEVDAGEKYTELELHGGGVVGQYYAWRARRNTPAADDVDARSLRRVTVVDEDADPLVYTFERGPQVHSVFWSSGFFPKPEVDANWVELEQGTLPLTGNSFSLPRPADGFNSFAYVVPLDAQGRRGRVEKVRWQGVPDIVAYSEVQARIISSDADSVVVEVRTVPAGGMVTLVGVTGSAVRESGPLPGVASPDGQQWTFTRGLINAGAGQAEFSGLVTGYESDTDFVTVEEMGRDTVPLVMRAQVVTPGATEIVVRVAVADPHPGGDISITYTAVGVGAVTPASPQTILAAAVATTLDTTGWINFTIPRGAVGGTPGRVTFTATRTGRTQDSDAVDVPAQEQRTEALVRVVSSTATTTTVQANMSPAGGLVRLVAITGSATLSSGPAVGVDSADGTQWTLSRGAINSGDGQAEFRATVNGATDVDFVVIGEQGRDTVPLAMRASVITSTSTGVTARVAVADPYPGADITIAYAAVGTGAITPASPQTILAAAVTANLDTTGWINFTVPRGAAGGGPGRVTFTATRAGRTPDADAVDVPPLETPPAAPVPRIVGAVVGAQEFGGDNEYTADWEVGDTVDADHGIRVKFFENGVEQHTSALVNPSLETYAWTDAGGGNSTSDTHRAELYLIRRTDGFSLGYIRTFDSMGGT